MKWINSFKLFESNYADNVENLVKDILIDLTDSGYKVYTSLFVVGDGGSHKGKQGLQIVVTSEESAGRGMVRTSNRLLPIEIGDYLLNIDSYLRELGWIGFNVNHENHATNVTAILKDVNTVFKMEVNEFQKYLTDGSWIMAPFNTINVKYFKL
jgi:hypothetical protein